MTSTSHALIGASIAAKIPNPFIALPLAFFSHFALDIIPHWDVGTNHRKKSPGRLKVEATIDVLIGFVLSFIIFRSKVDPIYMFVMIIAAQLPDWIEAPSSVFGLNIPPFSWFDWLGHKIQSRIQLPWGAVTQIVPIGIIVVLARYI